MDIEQGAERRLSRQDLLKWAALPAAPGWSRAARASRTRCAHSTGRERPPAGDGLGRLRQRRRPGHICAVREEVPGNKPKFTFMTNEANALGKIRAGFKPDVVHPCVGYVKYFADSGFVQPWDPAQLKNLKHLNPPWSRRARSVASNGGSPPTGASTRSSTARTR